MLLPVFDAPDTIAEAVQDILDQRGVDLELLVVHQGGADATLAAVQRFADPRLRLLRLDRPDVAVALEHGRAAARAPWLARMDGDDRCPPTRLADQLAHARATGAAVVPCRIASFPAGREQYLAWQNALLRHDQMAAERFVECPYLQGAALLRADAVAAVGGWKSGDFQEDYDLALRLFAAGVVHDKLPAVAYRWRIHPGQSTWRFSDQDVRQLKARHLDLPDDAYVAGTGRSLATWASLLDRPAVSFDPRHPQTLPPGFPVLVFGSARVRQRLRTALGDRPHVFVS